MAKIYVRDRVLLTSATVGTGAYALSTSAVSSGFVTPAAAGIPSGSTVAYVVVDSLTAPTMFERGRGVVTTGGTPTLTRAVIYGSSAGAAAINWPVGTRYVFFAPLSELLPILDTDGVLDRAVIPTPLSSLMRMSSPQSVPNSTAQVLGFDTLDLNTLGAASGGPPTWNGFVVPSSGLYDIDARVQFASNATGTRLLNLVVNGAFAIDTDQQVSAGVGQVNLRARVRIGLTAGNVLTLQVSQTSGGALDIGGGATTAFSILKN